MKLHFAIILGLLAGIALPQHAGARGINEADLRAHIAILASDDFEGRKPGTNGEEKTVAYIHDEWKAAGLIPAASAGENLSADAWFQNVPILTYAPKSQSSKFRRGNHQFRFRNDEIVLIGKQASYKKMAVPLYFAGTGVDIDGNAVSGVEGKAVLILEEASSQTPDALLPLPARVRLMADAGAQAVISVVSDKAWGSVQRRFSRQRAILQKSDNRAPVQGVVSAAFAVGLVSASGGDWDKLSQSAYNDDFALRNLRVTADFKVESDIENLISRNVIGKIAGKKPGSGAVLFMGHWDHFGECGHENDEDRICNGAVDNASGIAVLIEVAKKLARKKHDRDIYFLATTAEEVGLLGAYHFAENAPFELDTLAVALNLDTVAVAPRGTRVAIIGRDKHVIQPVVQKLVRKQRRKIDQSGEADIFIKRQDGWTLTQRGHPAFMIGSAFGNMDLLSNFLEGDYHGPNDELNSGLELGGAAQDANLHVQLGRYFANGRKYSLPLSSSLNNPVGKKSAEDSGAE